MSLKDKLLRNKTIQEIYLAEKFGANNIHDIDIKENIETGIVNRLLQARELNVKYVVVFGNMVPPMFQWDPYGDGTWNPKRDYITTEDIAAGNDREKERQNIYDFLRGKPAVKEELEEMFQEEVKTEEKPMEK